MKRKDLLIELKNLSVEDLRDRRKKAADEGMKLRFRKKTGQLEQPHRLLELKREIARINTILRAR